MKTWKPGDTAWIRANENALPVTILDHTDYGILAVMSHGGGAWFAHNEVYDYNPQNTARSRLEQPDIHA